MSDAFAPNLGPSMTGPNGDGSGAPAASSPAPAAPAPAERNPFSKESLNLADQGAIFKADPERAKSLIRAAGRERDYPSIMAAERDVRVTIPDQPAENVDSSVRLAQLEYMQRHDSVSYKVKFQAEHEALLAKQAERAEKGTLEPVRVLSDADARARMSVTEGGDKVIGELGEAGVAAARTSAVDLVNSIGDQVETQAFLSGVYSLPGEAQSALVRELGTAAPEVQPADSGAMQRFAAVEDGKALVDRWGTEAPAKVARFQARTSRLLKSMGPAQRQAAMSWFDGLPSKHALAVMEHLSK